jgi:hypothetical protein
MRTLEKQPTGARQSSNLALVVICLGYFMVIVDSRVRVSTGLS